MNLKMDTSKNRLFWSRWRQEGADDSLGAVRVGL